MRKVLSITGLALAGVLAVGPVFGQVSDEERQALIDFYHATGGDQWRDNSGWLGSKGSECGWHGIQCTNPQSGPRFVLRLMLPDNNLTGELPDSLAGLDRMQSLVLSDNELSGSMREDLWGLVALEDLFLDNNRLAGTIPAAILDLEEGAPITQVNLSGNPLTGFGAGPLPASPTPELELTLNDTLIDELPPPEWRATGVIQSLEMTNSGLEGGLDLSEPWPGLQRLELQGNAISTVDAVGDDLLPDLLMLNLADNDLAQWPAFLPELPALTELILRGNQLSGNLPQWFADLNLGYLDLDNNDLSGPIAGVFEGLDLDGYPQAGPHGELGLHLHVANNRFSGPLPDIDYASFNTPFQWQSSDFGLDLCFNDIEMPDAEMLEAIEPVHRGLALQSCIGREQASLDPTISGSWYQPERSGEGVTLMLLDNGQLLNYWFTYAPQEEDDQAPEQMWLVGVTDPADSYGEFKPMWITSGGRFGEGLADGSSRPSNTWVRQNRIEQDTLHFFYDYRGNGLCITGACFWDVLTGRLDQTRLSRLAGTTCDNRSAFQQYSGAWYNQERSGEGFIVEVLSDDRIVVYWFTHKPDDSGQQAWMIGSGTFPDGDIVAEPGRPWEERVELMLHQPSGARFGPQFDPDDVQATEWGELEMRFNGDGTGQIVWNSSVEGYGSGEYEVERLAQPMLADCGTGDSQSR